MKEIALGKRAKISQAQQYMILAVFGASIFLGAAIAVVLNSINKIKFNADTIIEEDQSIVAFSDAIKNIGICKSPSGDVYSEKELQECNPNGIEASEVPDTLRAKILEGIASNPALNSTPSKSPGACIKQDGKRYTYKELKDNYNIAETEEELSAASNLIKSCSALRIIPDALPATKNVESLLSSVNRIFIDSGIQPETIAPSDDDEETTTQPQFGTNLYAVGAVFALEETRINDINKLLTNAERSIRDFDFKVINLEWSNNNSVGFSGRAVAYHTKKSTFEVSDKSLTPGGK